MKVLNINWTIIRIYAMIKDVTVNVSQDVANKYNMAGAVSLKGSLDENDSN